MLKHHLLQLVEAEVVTAEVVTAEVVVVHDDDYYVVHLINLKVFVEICIVLVPVLKVKNQHVLEII